MKQTLTADISGIMDADGLPADDQFSYQWVQNDGTDDSDISGATDSTYLLKAADLGKTIKVRVTFTDEGGAEETLTSDATTAVAADTTGPTLESASVRPNGDRIRLDFSENIDFANFPDPFADAFTVTADGAAVEGITFAFAIENDALFLANLTPVIAQGQKVTVTYTDPTAGNDAAALQDAAGNDVATFTTGEDGVPAVTNDSAFDAIRPILTKAVVNRTGTSIELVFDENLDRDAENLPQSGALTVTADEVAVMVGEVFASGLSDSISFLVSPKIQRGQTVIVTYTDPTAGDDTAAIQDEAGNDAASFTTGEDDVPAVTNDSNVAPPPLISNIGQTAATGAATVSTTQSSAQGFTTGTNSGGYTLDSVELAVTPFDGTASDITVSIYSESSGDPGTLVHTLTTPGSLSDPVTTFTAPSGATLAASTTYYVVASTTNTLFLLSRTEATAEDTGGASGWSIADDRRFSRNLVTWTTATVPIRMRINGAAATATNPATGTVTSGMITQTSAVITVTIANPDTNTQTVNLQYKRNADTNWTSGGARSTVSAAVTFTLSGLTGNTDYDLRASLDSAFASGVVTASFTTSPTKPGKARGLTVGFEGDGQLGITWAPPSNDGGSAITGYKVQWKSGSQSFGDSSREHITSSTSYFITGLTNGTEYTVRVIAVNAVGDGPPSDEKTATPEGPPDAPPNVQAGSGHQQLTVSWGAPNDGGSAITEYRLQWKSGGQSFNSSRQRTIAAPSRTYTIPSLANGTEYTVRVRATNALGDSGWSAEAKGTPREGPHVSTVRVKEPISCTVTFVALDFVNLEAATEYQAHLRFRAQGSLSWTVLSPQGFWSSGLPGGAGRGDLNGPSPSFTLPDLAYETAYEVQAALDSGFVDGLATTTFSTPNLSEAGLTPLSPGDGTLVLRMTRPTSEGRVDGYLLQWKSGDEEYDDTDTSERQADVPGSGDREYTITGLDNGVEYTVRAMAYNDNGVGVPSSEVRGTPEAPPNSPARGAPTISGTAQVGETLTADTDGIEDDDGLADAVYSYQWLADGADVAGATSDTYTPVADDVGKAIKVKVSFRDDRNHQESLTSVRLRHARKMLPRTVEALFALERDAALAGPEDEVWRPAASGPPADLRNALGQLAPGGELPVEANPSQADLPGDGAPDADRALPVLLKPAEKRALDLIYDWPWLLRTELASLMAVSERRASQLVNPLEGFGLVTRPIDGSGRLALTDRGVALLARRDRTSVAVARRRWSVAPVDAEAPYDWRNVSGGRSRQLLRNIEHTGAVHAFVAALARQAHALGWELAQIDPPRSASRHFKHEGRNRSVNPDAFGVLRKGPAASPFFLEWERRAVRPSTMATRIAPYLRYYLSHSPIDDHGARPSVLIVFDDDIAATNFLRVARDEMDRAGVSVPLWVSHSAVIDALATTTGVTSRVTDAIALNCAAKPREADRGGFSCAS